MDQHDVEHLREVWQAALEAARAAGARDPEDVAQDTVLKYVVETSTSQIDNWRGWIWVVAKRRTRDEQRLDARRAEDELPDEDRVFQRELRQHGPSQDTLNRLTLVRVLAELSSRDQAIFLDRFEHGLSAEETAQRHGVAKTSVDQAVWRGRQRLAEKFPNLVEILGMSRVYSV